MCSVAEVKPSIQGPEIAPSLKRMSPFLVFYSVGQERDSKAYWREAHLGT